VISPASESEVKGALSYAVSCDGPVAIRYPRDVVPNGVIEQSTSKIPFETGKSVTIREGREKIVIVALGSVLSEAVVAAEQLADKNIDVGVVNARFAKPLDDAIVSLVLRGYDVVTVEDHGVACGFGSAVLEAVAEKVSGGDNRGREGSIGRVVTLGGPDSFVRVATRAVQMDDIGISAVKIAATVEQLLRSNNNPEAKNSR
jgi:1-deoxy-D-xylulose-5-phosphate synthase